MAVIEKFLGKTVTIPEDRLYAPPNRDMGQSGLTGDFLRPDRTCAGADRRGQQP